MGKKGQTISELWDQKWLTSYFQPNFQKGWEYREAQRYLASRNPLWQSVHWSLSTSSLSPHTHRVHMLPTLKGDNPVLFSNCDCLKSQISGWSHIIFILSRCYYFVSWSPWMKYSKMSVLLLVRCIYFLNGDEIEATKDTNPIGREEEWYGGVSAPWRLWNHSGQKL